MIKDQQPTVDNVLMPCVITPITKLSSVSRWPLTTLLSSRYLVCIAQPQTLHVVTWWCLDVLSSSLRNQQIILSVLCDPGLKPPQFCVSPLSLMMLDDGRKLLASDWLTRPQYWPLIGNLMQEGVNNWPVTTAIIQHHGNYPLATTSLCVTLTATSKHSP